MEPSRHEQTLDIWEISPECFMGYSERKENRIYSEGIQSTSQPCPRLEFTGRQQFGKTTLIRSKSESSIVQ